MSNEKNILDVNSLQLEARNNYLKYIYPYVTSRVKLIFSLWSGFFIVFLTHCATTIPNLINEDYRTHLFFFPFWGFITSQFSGYFLASFCNPNKLFGGVIVTSSLLNIFIPVSLAYVPHLAITLRFTQGFMEGIAITCCYSIWTSWSPQAERATVAPLSFSGCFAGFMLGLPFCQYFAQSVSWKYPFFYAAFLGILWFALWRPSLLKKLCEDEQNENDISVSNSSEWQTCSMFLPVWVICISCFCILIIFQAYFLKESSSLATEMSILFSLVPNLAMAIPLESIVMGYFAKPGQVFNSQRIFYSCILLIEAVFLLIAVVVKNVQVATTALTLAMFLSGAIMSGFYFNNLSVIPVFAYSLMGVSTVARNIACLLVVNYHQRYNIDSILGQWRTVFILIATLYLSMVMIYTISVNSIKRSWTYTRLNEETSRHDVEEQFNGQKRLVYMIHI